MKGLSHPLHFVALSVVWLSLLLFAGTHAMQHPLWAVLLLNILIATPLFIAGVYGSTVRRIHRATLFNHQGLVYWLVTGRIIACIGWALWSVVSALLLIFYLGTSGNLEMLLILTSPPIFVGVYAINWQVVSRELKPYIATHMAMVSSRRIFAGVMALTYLTVLILAGASSEPLGLADAIERVSAERPIDTDSVLLGETARLLVQYQGIQLFVLSNLQTTSNTLYLFFILLGSLALYFNIGLVLSACIIPVREFRRVLAPVTDTDTPPPLLPQSVAMTTSLTLIALLFIYLPTGAYLEYWLKQHPNQVVRARDTRQAVVETLEMIENRYYTRGTIGQIQQLQTELLIGLNVELDKLAAQSDQGFSLMADNVDDYLDWYYSLVAEYTRIAAMLSGNLETLMTEQLHKHLMQGNAFDLLQQSLERSIREHRDFQTEYRQQVQKILDENQVQPASDHPEVTRVLPLDKVLEPPGNNRFTQFDNRIVVSGAASAITAAITAKIVAKVVSKGTIKLGAKALTKVAASKIASTAGGSAAGAATGAAVGSIVPGLGTLAGGVIGGIVGGLAVGVTVEVLLLMLEEHLSRDEFRQQIVGAIDEAREEYKDSLYGHNTDAAVQ
ncbi:MAG: hypothetical protein GY703_06210 [Gammaproteobacteria bacterium]|nr:hypothetical protein [Gammaproteobacteria bacterium]